MVSLSLMDALLAAAPERARIVLLGDRHQLASVQAGAVLADLCAGGAGVPWIAELSRSHRFEESSSLGDLARAVNSGRTADAMAALDAGRDRGEVVLHPEPDARAAVDEIARRACALFAEVRREADPAGRLGLLARSGVLCAHRRGALGAEHVNREVERRLVASGQIPSGAPWYDGRPVIALRNDPRAGISNGDMGVVCRAAESAQLAICFAGEDGRVRSLAPGLVGAHETAFAITVHKAQGSEFDEVAVVLPAAPSPVTTRELLYTAVTRARSRVEIFGRPEVIAAAIETPTVRFSGLAERLSGS
jgi:exodeoxyribonuclease V alpha subunit